MKPSSPHRPPVSPAPSKEAKQARLGQALRANLARRKAKKDQASPSLSGGKPA